MNVRSSLCLPSAVSEPKIDGPINRNRERALVALLVLIGLTGLVGGIFLAARPDGSLLHAKPSALVGTPFRDWRVPGILLAALVGGGLLGAGLWLAAHLPYRREIGLVAAVGLFAFEVVQFLIIGFQGLQVVIGVAALVMATLAWGLR